MATDTTPSVPLSRVLGRSERLTETPRLKHCAVTITGANGFIGARVSDLVRQRAIDDVAVFDCDLPHIDVLNPATLPDADWCLHLAAHKYATTAEVMPAEVADLNIRGTQNVVDKYGANVVLASTCKAADPMTAYGASKLIAERIVLNAGGRVVRFVNVLGSSGSVVPMWAATPGDEPLSVTACERMWMSPAEASHLLVAAMGWPTGRYALDVPAATPVADMAARLHPGRGQELVPVRRGDRVTERLVAEYEHAEPFCEGVVRIVHPFD